MQVRVFIYPHIHIHVTPSWESHIVGQQWKPNLEWWDEWSLLAVAVTNTNQGNPQAMVIQALGQKGWRHPNKLELAWQHSRVACFAVGFCAMRGWGDLWDCDYSMEETGLAWGRVTFSYWLAIRFLEDVVLLSWELIFNSYTYMILNLCMHGY